MKEDKDPIRDIAEIRSMMERSSKFLSLSGLSGVMAGIYALCGAYIADICFDFHPSDLYGGNIRTGFTSPEMKEVILLGVVVLILAIGTGIFLSAKKANNNGEKLWNASSRQMVWHMAIPLLAGGILVLLMIENGIYGLVSPLTLVFYGLALFSAGKFTFPEVKSLGLIQLSLGLLGCFIPDYGLLFWAFGFGIAHIIYGIYMHYKYER